MIMENQIVFNFVVAIAGFLGVFVFNTVTRKLQKLEDKLAELPREYVQKDDYRADIGEIKAILKQIFDKLDSKQDK
jgi:low affinity Fe/Cu permease